MVAAGQLLVIAAACTGASSLAPVSRAQATATAPGQARAAAAPEQPRGSKVWPGRHRDFEEFLKTAVIVKVDNIPVGVTKPKRAFFEPGGLAGSAVVKLLPAGVRGGFWEGYKSEIAAYKLDRILGLDMVPPTIERRVDSELASLQLWVESCKLLKDIEPKARPRSIAWAKQACRQRTFDNLIANVDRNEGNLLVDEEWNLVLIDHSRAFASNTMPFLKEMTRIDRKFYEKLKALDEATLVAELGPWVRSAETVRDLLQRRDKIVARFDDLARQTSEAAVFPF